ncbi:high affinity immunoglobulin gamma Fc receptor I-like isoform 2-T2 [Polymixia lowei]
MVFSLLVVSTLPQFVVPELQGLSVAPYQAVIEKVSGDSRIFSGENIRLRCSIPNVRSTWRYQWFRGDDELQESAEYSLWQAKVEHSGKYYCQGVRETVIGTTYTHKSLPVEIDVDGGWAILQVPPYHSLVGETLKVTCRVRGNPKLEEVILYRDDVEVMRQIGSSPHLHLANIALKDQGLYSCRATWDVRRRSHSVVSVATQVSVLEVLTEPVLRVVLSDPLVPANMMRLICHLQYNAHAPAPPLHFYFYKNGYKLATATSENNEVVKQTPGLYSCKARVPQLGLLRWSEPEAFGQVTGTQQRQSPSILPRAPNPLTSIAPGPGLPLPTTAPFTAAWPTTHQSTAGPTDPPSTEEIPQPTDAPLKPIQSVPRPQLPDEIVQPNNQTAPPEVDDMSGDSDLLEPLADLE